MRDKEDVDARHKAGHDEARLTRLSASHFNVCSPHERSDMRDAKIPGYRFAHPGYEAGAERADASLSLACPPS
jgi:hypothetical protein